LSYRRGVHVAAALIFTLAGAQTAVAGPDACTLDAPVALCQGNQSDGIAFNSTPYTILIINNLTADIAPASPTIGVDFTSTNSITLSVDLGAHSIITTGGGIGIHAASSDSIVLSSIGNVSTSGNVGDGIFAGATNDVTLSSIGNVATTGDGARGVAGAATSGALTISSIGNITTSGNDSGSGGAHGLFGSTSSGSVTLLSIGNITTSGNGSDGISANNSGSGDTTIITSGNIAATGNDSFGISAAGASGNISITIASGSVSGGSGSGAGVEFIGGATNMLHNFGTVSALSGWAIEGSGGDETVNNHGTVTGSVNLGGGSNAFNNFAGALFNSGTMVNLNGGTLTNAGTLAPGGVGTVGSTSLTGDFVQTGSGAYVVDLDPLGSTTADFIVVSGSASLNGTVVSHSLSLPTGAQTYTIVVAGSPVTDLGATLLSSPALHATLLFNSNLVQIATDVNFSSVSGLNGNQRAISNSLHQAFAAGGGGLTPVLLGLLNTDGLDAYKAALNELSPEVLSDAQITALYSSLGFANSLLSCRVNGTTTASVIHEGQCLWAGASAVFLDQGTTFNQIGFDQTTGLFAAGAQVALNNLWRLGVGASYQSSWLETGSNATSDGQQGQAGVALKYNPGPLLLAGVLSGGRGWYDTTRPMAFGGFAASAQSDSTIDVLNGGVRVAYVLGSPQLYAKPMLDAAATHLDLNGFSETGGGAANLSVRGSNQTVYTIAPSLEIGTEWWMANGTLVRPFLRGGATWYENGDLALSAAFLSAPAGVSPFTITTGMDDVMGTVGAGLDLITSKDTALHVTYDGQFGATTQISAIALKGSARF
jgi:Autotransporter beta-domain